MIRDHLPAYYAALGSEPSHNIVRSIMIDGHEVAWLESAFTAPDGSVHKQRMLLCECDFAEGIGWSREEGQAMQIAGQADWCIYKKAAQDLRIRELRKEYFDRFLSGHYGETWGLQKHLEEVIFDIRQKVEAGEFVEGSTGAAFYGGFAYLQTVAEITKLRYVDVQTVVDRMQKEKKVSRYEGIIAPYREPPKPEWVESFRTTDDEGWTAVALLPKYRTMERVWRFDVYRPDGGRAETTRGGELTFPIDFGVDVSDLETAHAELQVLVAEVRKKNAGHESV